MPQSSRITIDISAQTLLLETGGYERRYTISSAKNGTGCEEGSCKTPLGHFRIAEKIGTGLPEGTIFKSRQPVGIWPHDVPTELAGEEDLILSRILWLDGLDEDNANTYRRYVYIHGTNAENQLGIPLSCGCIRMSNAEIIDLYDRVETGTLILIHA